MRCSADGDAGHLPRQLPHRAAREPARTRTRPALRADRGRYHRRAAAGSAPDAHRPHLQPGLRRLAAALPGRSGAYAADQRARHAQPAAPRRDERRALFSGLDERGLWRPAKCIRRLESYWGNVNPTGPRACYDEGKRAAETLELRLSPVPAAPTCASRASSTPMARACAPTMAASSPTRHPGAGRRATSPSTATAARRASFCYVDDLVEGLLRLMRLEAPCPARQPRQSGGVDGRDLVERVVATDRIAFARSCTGRCRWTTRGGGGRILRWPPMLGWAPRVPLEVGLHSTIAWFGADRRPDTGFRPVASDGAASLVPPGSAQSRRVGGRTSGIAARRAWEVGARPDASAAHRGERAQVVVEPGRDRIPVARVWLP